MEALDYRQKPPSRLPLFGLFLGAKMAENPVFPTFGTTFCGFFQPLEGGGAFMDIVSNGWKKRVR